MTDPRTTLIETLIEGTRSEVIHWEQANNGATAFIAKRPSGTVTVEGTPGGIAGPLSQVLGMGSRLVVKDGKAKTLETIEAPQGTNLGAMLTLNPAAKIPTLFNLVHEQVTRAEATMANLTREFKTPEAD